MALLLTTCLCGLTKAQTPEWLDTAYRQQCYDERNYLTGFACVDGTEGLPLARMMQQAKADAQTDLSKKIRMQISSVTRNRMSARNTNGHYEEQESFEQQSSATTDTDIAGIKFETYYDTHARLAYAFAYVNKTELSGYYKAQIHMLLQQTESILETASRLEELHEKESARKECGTALPLFGKIRYAQALLLAVDASAQEALCQERTELLYDRATQLSARLAQGIYVWIESDESLFGVPCDIVASKLKALLAENGCSFVRQADEADRTIHIRTSVASSSEKDGVVYCFAETSFHVYDTHKQKILFADRLSVKGGSLSREKAGRGALYETVPKIMEEIKPWIK